MDIETTLAQSIRTSDEKAKYDAACKRLLSADQTRHILLRQDDLLAVWDGVHQFAVRQDKKGLQHLGMCVTS